MLMQCVGRLADLSVIDSGSQRLVANATLYQREHLAASLGISSKSDDAELILAAYRRWGAECPAHLNGDFHFIVEDRERATLYAAVDHMAVRPLFYTQTADRVLFSASVRELVDAMGGEPELDDAMVASLLVQRSFFCPSRTLCSAIHRVPFGHWAQWENGRVATSRYWLPETVAPLELDNAAAYVDLGRRLFTDAVRDRMPDRGSLGVHVSGGLDSSAIAVLATRMRRAWGQPDPTGFAWQRWQADDDPACEGGWVAAVQRELGIDVPVAMPAVEDVAALLKLDLAADYDVGDLFQESIVQREASARGIGLILSGWGGDESLSFSGAYMARHHLLRGRLQSLAGLHPAGGVRGLLDGAMLALRDQLRPASKISLRKLIRRSLASRSLLARTAVEPAWNPTAKTPRGYQLDRLMSGYLSERIAILAQSGARHGLRYSFPMLDRRVIEFALSVPVKLFRQGPQRRWLFREMMRGVLPESVRLNRSKLEPERVGELLGVIHAALTDVGQSIERGGSFRRAQFLDMERLRHQLQHPEIEPLGPLRMAVQLLDH